jgi:hypothetical protein
MKRSFRRYEILLPLQFNDGRPVPAAVNHQTLSGLRKRFGGASAETQAIEGEWSFRGKVFRDKSARIFVDVPDTPESRAFFVRFKKILERRYRQLDMWITSYPIELF